MALKPARLYRAVCLPGNTVAAQSFYYPGTRADHGQRRRLHPALTKAPLLPDERLSACVAFMPTSQSDCDRQCAELNNVS
jgi:hypothetical protein